MNLSWLEDFLALAASGNFSRAAAERHMTQPAFSRRIRALEDWLGVQLFDRSGQPARLTDAGQWLQDVAQDILARVARIPHEARAVAAAGSATLRFAATHALSLTFLPVWLRGLESRTPVGPIQLMSDVLPQCEALMRQGSVHFMLCHAHAAVPSALESAANPSLQVGSDSLVPVAAAGPDGRPLFKLGNSCTAPPPLLAYSAESGLGRLMRGVLGAVLQTAGVEPVFTAHLATVLKSMVLQGRGIAWLPQSLISDELASGRLLQAGDDGLCVVVDVRLFRSSARQSAAAQAFWLAASEAAAG